MLLYKLVTVSVLAFAGIGLKLHGVAVVLHAVMAVWCIGGLRR
jgi:hypothetical protein